MIVAHGLAGMPGLLLSALIAAAGSAGQEDTPKVSCIVCHGKQGTELTESIHSEIDLACTACHGGDPNEMSKKACVDNPAFLGVPKGTEITEGCGACHADQDMMRQYNLPSDQLALFKTSPHGQRLYGENDQNVPTCIDCHGAHAIKPISDPESPAYRSNLPNTCGRCHSDEERMDPYGLPSDVLDGYRKSVHGRGLLEKKELRLPNCGDCHSTHAARPAGIREVVNVCGHCHVVTRDYFRKSSHFAAAERGEMEECTTCHGHHDIEPAATLRAPAAKRKLCGRCHDPDDPDDVAWSTAVEMDRLTSVLASRIDLAADQIHAARSRGLVTRDEEDYLNEAKRFLITAAPASHSMSVDQLRDITTRASGILDKIEETTAVKVRHVRDRRIFATIVFGIVLLLVIILDIKRRRILAAARNEIETTS